MGQAGSSDDSPHKRTPPPPIPRPFIPTNVTEVQRGVDQTRHFLVLRAENIAQRARVQAEVLRRVHHRGISFAHLQHCWRRKLNTLQTHPEHTVVALATGAVVGVVMFAATRLTCSFALQSARISSANRILATAGGAVSLALCANVAANSALIAGTLTTEWSGFRNYPIRAVDVTDPTFLPFTAILTAGTFLQYRLLRGRLRNFAPSDVMRRGTFAHKHIDAPGNEYADQRTKRLLAEAGGKYGCHSCGRSKSWWGMGPRLNFIGDHIPPNKYAKLADLASGAVTAPGMPRGLWARLWPFKPKKTKQVFLPQCERCSLIQSNAVRMDRRTLIFPRSWRWYDVWFPFPLGLALLCLPLLDQLEWLMWEETPDAEDALQLWPNRPGRKKRLQSQIQEQPDGNQTPWWKPW